MIQDRGIGQRNLEVPRNVDWRFYTKRFFAITEPILAAVTFSRDSRMPKRDLYLAEKLDSKQRYD